MKQNYIHNFVFHFFSFDLSFSLPSVYQNVLVDALLPVGVLDDQFLTNKQTNKTNQRFPKQRSD
jgi:hypothetical protein